MLKVFFKTTVFVVLFFVPQIVFGSVVINEVFYNPEGTDTGKEYVVLYNNGDSMVDLTGWELDPSDAPYFAFSAFSLAAKQFVTIHINCAGANTDNNLFAGKTTAMGNDSGPIALFNSSTHSKTTIVDYIEYGEGGQTNESKAVDAGIWTTGNFIPGAAEGKSIKLKTDGADTNSPNDWIESNPTIAPEEPASTSEQTTTQETESSPSGVNNPPLPDAGNDIIAFVDQE
ncbi:MAG: lamin tail domain-containing protein, partial [bacterium]|nr:lamin tail domain-containing protein [bacterium]